jgi:hypothetical protein
MGLKSSLTPIIAGWVWISGCEYGINQVWLKSQWDDYFGAIGVTYPGDITNLALWAGWCLAYAIAMRMMLARFGALFAGIITWILVFGLTMISLSNFGMMDTEMLKLFAMGSLAEAISAALVMSMFVGINRARVRSRQRAKEKAKAAKSKSSLAAA